MKAGFFGNLGSGKTISMVKACYDTYKDTGKMTISNIKLNFPYKHLILDDLFKIAFSDNEQEKRHFFENHILAIDELHNVVDARKSGSNLNTFFTQFFTQLGKLDVDFYFTSQIFSSQIDLRIRELTDIIVTCMKIDDKGKLKIFGPRITKDKIYIAMMIEIVMFGLDNPNNPKGVQIYDPAFYYDKYDTKELVILDRSKYLKERFNV